MVDVAVDVRRGGSPWFGKYVMVELSADSPSFSGYHQLRPCFQALEDDTLFLYLQTKEYSPQHERCIAWNDPEIGIPWPIKENVIISEKDSKCHRLGRLRRTSIIRYNQPSHASAPDKPVKPHHTKAYYVDNLNLSHMMS